VAPKLDVEPASIELLGPEGEAQLVVFRAGRDVTLTETTSYECLDPAIARVDGRGRVRSVGDGSTWIRVAQGGGVGLVKVNVSEVNASRPVDFVSEVAPILSRLGCNAGMCHGKSSGQNGFRLTLFGFDPGFDHQSLVRDAQGRRVSRASPETSLLLMKPTGRMAHGGGKRMEIGSPEYRTIARWIGQGMPYSDRPRNRISTLDVRPRQRIAARNTTGQLRVVAKFEDGREADVTRLARFESHDPDIVQVDDTGRVMVLDGSVGTGSILARFGGRVGMSRIVVPNAVSPGKWTSLPARNLIDRFVSENLTSLNVAPSPPSLDFEFARRSAVDILGRLPTPDEVKAFEDDRDPDKRLSWIKRLVDRPEYADRFAMMWSALLRNKRTLGPLSQPGTFAFHAWIREALAENLPYDRFVEAILTAHGDSARNPAVVWLREARPAEATADDAAQLFLGTRLQCARCHHHPYEPWSQNDAASFARFFSRVGRKPGIDAYSSKVFLIPAQDDQGESPRFLGGETAVDRGRSTDPRQALADWMRRPDNPYFARAVVNRYWKHFFGRGLVDPEDDLRESNPESFPGLLDALAHDFIEHGYDLKHLVRTFASSRAYERSSAPIPGNEADRQNLARFPARRLPAEVLLDAIDTVTGTSESFAGLPRGFRAVQLPDEGFDTPSRFLDVFGRPRRESVCDCERSSEPSLGQGLYLLNSTELERKVSHPEGRAARWAAQRREDGEIVEELYRLALSRPPSAEERSVCLEHLRKRRSEAAIRKGIEDLIWTLINTKEFSFVQ
jgi:hypothetical protein